MPKKMLLLLAGTHFLLFSAVFAQTNKLEATGNVGIGTLAPSEKLTIYNGNQIFRKQFGTGSDYDWLTIGSHEQSEKAITGVFTGILGTNLNPGLDLNGKPTSRNMQPTNAYRQSWALTFGSGNFNNNFSIWGAHHASNNLALTPMFNLSSDGYVGIGTTNPSTHLDVNGNIKLSGFLYNETSDANTSIRLKPNASNTTTITGIFEAYEKSDVGNSASASFGITNTPWGVPLPSVTLMSTKQGSATAKDIMIWAHDNPSTTNSALCIKANSNNIGIGTTNPGDYKLAVVGTIGAKKLRVTQSWADFVFDPGYILPTLKEIESHIKSKNHLPGIPSAKEIEQQGLDVGEMQQKQMQKIEELTLYMIDLNKKLEIQQQLILDQQKTILEQGKELKDLKNKGARK